MNKNVDWLGKPYYSLNAFFRHVYGQKVYKIAVDAGLTCPNRDGRLDNRGCIFCSAGGSGDFAVGVKSNTREITGDVSLVRAQINEGLSKFNKKVGDKFVIYFQAFTNTYGDIEYLRRIWTEALKEESVVGISIATRPDCLEEQVLQLLSQLKEEYSDKFIWIELGLQTIHEKTTEYIRRHYLLSVYEKAILNLGRLEIPFITHVIFGLPGENREDMLETVFYVEQGIFDYDSHRRIKPFGMKLQLLHVLRGTDLAEDYSAGVFDTMELEEYIDLTIEALQRIDPNIVIHRVTGDGPKNILVAPKWSGNKKLVLNTLHKKMAEQGARQGDYGVSLL